MKQEKVAGKILVELLMENIIEEKDEWTVYNYLMQAYAAGYVEGSKKRSNKRPVAQYSLDGKLIEIFDSAAEAARRTKVQHSDICKAAVDKPYNAKGWKIHTAGGFKWRYVNIKDGKTADSSEGDGTVGGQRGEPSGQRGEHHRSIEKDQEDPGTGNG